MKRRKGKATSEPPSRVPTAYDAEKYLRNFCNATSHELANAIGTIVGELEHAKDLESATAKTRSIGVALDAAKHALDLSRNLRYFATHTRLDVHSVDLSQVILDTVELVEDEWVSHNIEAEVVVDAGTHSTVDPGAIQQVLLNLLTNARNAMPQGGKLSISLTQKSGYLELIVSDSGKGMSVAQTKKLFEPQIEVPDSTHFAKDKVLGLAVSKTILEAHGGQIAVDSAVNKGTSFTITLPFEPQTQQPLPFLEKRRHRRVHLSMLAELIVQGAVYPAELTTLSVGGCYIRLLDTRVPLPEPQSTVSLRVYYYDDQVAEIASARVASNVTEGNFRGAGLEFMELDEKALRIVTAIVKSHNY